MAVGDWRAGRAGRGVWEAEPVSRLSQSLGRRGAANQGRRKRG
jgi:hypothetical protein